LFTPNEPSRWWHALATYRDARLWRIFGLGISSGFPWVIIGSAMTAWLSEEGISRSSIGFFGLIFIVYSINFLWSPLLDRVRLPLLGELLGQRRGWILLMQLLMTVCCLGIAWVSPADHLAQAKLLALMLALASATQDISIDAFRIDSFLLADGDRVAAGSAMATMGWWTGFAGLGALPFFLSDLDGWSWAEVYQVMAAIMLLLTLVPLLAEEPVTTREAVHRQRTADLLEQVAKLGAWICLRPLLALFGGLVALLLLVLPPVSLSDWQIALLMTCMVLMFAATLRELLQMERRALGLPGRANPASRAQGVVVWLIVSFVEPLAEFFRRNGVWFALSILVFIFLFKIGEAFLGRMSIVFYKEVGFSNSDIALYSKLVSWWVTILFSLLGSLVTIRYGILRGLFIGGIAMSASNLLFALLAAMGPDKAILFAAVFVDGFTSAWSTVAFVAFLSVMCNQAFTASQYALMASIGTLGRTFLASYSGAIVDWLEGDWVLFFLLTTVMVVPSLLFLYWIRHRLRALSDAL
jgi:PAT family beta-lactamase induction signal transducer AmpG